MDRGADSIETLLDLVLFTMIPQIIDGIVIPIFLVTQLTPWILVIAGVTVALYIPVTFYISNYRSKFMRGYIEQVNKKTGLINDALINYETIKYFNNEDRETDRFNDSVVKSQDTEYRLVMSFNMLSFVQRTIMFAGQASGFILCSAYIAQGKMTVGDLILFTTLIQQLYAPLNQLSYVYRQVQEQVIAMEKMFDLLKQQPGLKDKQGAPDLQFKNGELEFRNVSFKYGDETTVLRNISFKVHSGQTIAFIGATGSGKSTLLRLIFRFYDCQEGEILFDGQEVRDVKQSSIRKYVSMVPQDLVLFNDTITYNIAYGAGSREVDLSEVEDVARAAYIHDQITHKFPQQYLTVVGERGLRLSGGEKQRVAFARAILKQAPILVLDEATSALDSFTEKGIQASLNRNIPNRTTIIVAHRLSTIRDADFICILKDGEIVEIGNHSDLLEKNGVYADMWFRQVESSHLTIDQLSAQRELPDNGKKS